MICLKKTQRQKFEYYALNLILFIHHKFSELNKQDAEMKNILTNSQVTGMQITLFERFIIT